MSKSLTVRLITACIATGSVSLTGLTDALEAQVIRYSVDSAPLIESEIPAWSQPVGNSFGKMHFKGTYEGPGYTISTHPVVDFKNLASQILRGPMANEGSQAPILEVHNTSSETKDFDIEVQLALPMALEASEADGLVVLTLTTNPGGGSLSCSSGMAPGMPASGLLALTHDDNKNFFSFCPFNMGSSGSSDSTTTLGLGALGTNPGQGVAASGERLHTLGFEAHLKLTPGEKVKVSLLGILRGELLCTGDQDLDDKVTGADIGMLFGEWGSVPSSPLSDLNSDGIVDAQDLLPALNSFGECSAGAKNM